MRILQGIFTCTVVFLSVLAAGTSFAQDEQGASDMEMPQLATGSGDHPIGWVEFLYKDQAKTQEFYSKVFGWTFEPFAEGYFLYTTPAGLGGGFNSEPLEESRNTVIYLYAKDIPAKLEQVKLSGGTVVREMKIVNEESGGGIAYFKDLAGVFMGLANMEAPQEYEPDAFKSTEGLVLGSIVSIELFGGELEKTGEFYQKVFGWATNSYMTEYLMFNTGKGLQGVFQGHTPVLPVMPYIWVEDVATALDVIEAAGGKRLGGAMNMEGMPTFGYFTDPDGNSLGLMSPGS